MISHNADNGRDKDRLGFLPCRMECGKTFRIGTGFSDHNRDDPPK